MTAAHDNLGIITFFLWLVFIDFYSGFHPNQLQPFLKSKKKQLNSFK